MVKTCIFLFIVLCFGKNKDYAQAIIPIHFPEYDISIETTFKIGDTVLQKYTSNEYFRFVFFDFRGKCYCERYINKKLYERGYYENSLDTLKEYSAIAYIHGRSSKIFVQRFFQPLKNGEWITYKNGTPKSELYVMGVLANKLVGD